MSIPKPRPNGTGANLWKHGLWWSAEYRTWTRINARCNNPNMPNYHQYGGRGIKVCERWRSFINFFNDMGPRPSPAHTIDRINGELGYCPENCRWATWTEQNNNLRNNVVVTFRGKTQTVPNWCRELGLNYGRVRQRITKFKMPPELAFQNDRDFRFRKRQQHTET